MQNNRKQQQSKGELMKTRADHIMGMKAAKSL